MLKLIIQVYIKFGLIIFLGSSEALLKETREDLTAKIRLARQRHRNNDEAAVKKVYYPVNPKQLCKFQTKDLGRNVNKDKRKQNYAYSRRE